MDEKKLSRKLKGQWAEEHVSKLLRNNYFRILARNWRPQIGSQKFAEIDLVALSPQNVVWLIEVKSRTFHYSVRDLDDELISREQRKRLLLCYYGLAPYIRKKYRNLELALAWVAPDKGFVRFLDPFDI